MVQAAEGAGIPAAEAQLSLNKREPLPHSPTSLVRQLGVASGDLVYLLSDSQGYPAAAAPPPRPAVVHVRPPAATPVNHPTGPAASALSR